ncbi:TPA: helix-turn-helix domain-containing protein, partial [Escherichia coli]|nr:helix-turn-helix domain-containing protein [Escherichia coli]
MKHDELNERLRTFLISSRENAGLSQSDVAARSEVFGIGRTLDQRAVSRIESQPMNADAIKIAGYLSAVGIQPSKYYEILTEYTYKEDDYIMSE